MQFFDDDDMEKTQERWDELSPAEQKYWWDLAAQLYKQFGTDDLEVTADMNAETGAIEFHVEPRLKN